MLDKLRENSRSLGTYLIIGAISIVFVIFFGQGSLGFTDVVGGTPTWAAKVNGEQIPVSSFQRRYGAMLQTYQQQMGGQADDMARQLGLMDMALNQLVERHLLVEAARDAGLAVSDKEVADVVKTYPDFQVNGQFDYDTYRMVLANNGLKAEAFEKDIREGLLAEKMVQQVRQSAKASDEEVEAEFRRDSDKANLTFVRFSAMNAGKDAKPTQEEIAAFLSTPEGKEQVSTEFEANRFRYEQPKRVSAQHILVKVEENASDEEVAAAEEKVKAARARIEGGEDFAVVAREVSEDPGSKDKGGDLGFFGPGTMARPFEEAAFALNEGEISDVVRTRFGMHVIRVNEIQEAKSPSLEDVQEEIASGLVAQRKAREVARARAEATLAKVQAGEPLADLFPAPEGEDAANAPADLIAAEDTGLFNVASEYVPKVGVSAELAKAARAATAGDVLPSVYETSGYFVVAEVKEREAPDMKDFEENADLYRRRVLARKEAALIQSFTEGLREAAKVEKHPAIFASADGTR